MLSTVLPWGYAAICATFVVALGAMAVPGAFRLAEEPGRIPGFDGLRGLAALGVFCHHFLIANVHLATGEWRVPGDTLFANLGPVAVTLFFFITAVLFYRRAPAMLDLPQWARLLFARLFRLMPLYLVVLALVIVALFASAGFVPRTGLWQNIAALGEWLSFGVGPAGWFNGDRESPIAIAYVIWTLRYEWLFYLALPLLGCFVRLLNPRPARIAVLAGLYGALALMPPLQLGWFSADIGSTFLLGMLAMELAGFAALSRLLRGALGAAVALSGFATALALPVPAYDPLQQLAAFAAFVPIACGQTLQGALMSPALRRLGTVSYGLYLFHGLLLFVSLRALSAIGWLGGDARSWLWLPLLALPLILLARSGYRWIEAPGIALGRRLAARLDPQRQAGEPVPLRT